MFGKATLQVPRCGVIEPSHETGLSDELAMVLGRIAATTLSEQDGFVLVTLENGQQIVIGNDTTTDRLTIGRLSNDKYGRSFIGRLSH